ncbi:hypothetical protein [Kordiimonas aestuarii]|uniref:hypothetical protein n=1 Tax=Kordiimonas aestuarii TaxID=1005925 RepID=UPI0021D0FE35|nr:hypothetical protein [Kordiimonas aestuarii]
MHIHQLNIANRRHDSDVIAVKGRIFITSPSDQPVSRIAHTPQVGDWAATQCFAAAFKNGFGLCKNIGDEIVRANQEYSLA